MSAHDSGKAAAAGAAAIPNAEQTAPQKVIMAVRKGYICRIEHVRAEPEKGKPARIDYWFSFKIEDAWYWETRLSAERDLELISRGIDIEAENGGKYHCQDFKIDQRAPQEFVIYCEAPFAVAKTSGTGQEQ